MSEHTPEPWEQRRERAAEGVLARRVSLWSNKGSVATFDDMSEPKEGEANCARTVACVNALAGIDDPAAFRRAVDELVRIGDYALGVIDECWRFAEGDEQERESIRRARLHLAHALAAVHEQLPEGE